MQLALIVDDSKTARVMLRRMLDKLQIPTAMVESAEEALEYLQSHHPDVIFMDHMMPGMDGFSAVKAIKADPETASIPIVMHTTQQGDIYVGQARALGATDILIKPATDQDLMQVLGRVSEFQEQPGNSQEFETTVLEPVDTDDEAVTVKAKAAVDPMAVTTEMPVLNYPPQAANNTAFFGFGRQWLLVLVWLFPLAWLLSLYLSQQQTLSEIERSNVVLYRSVEWLVNQQPGYDYGEDPMGEQRLALLSALVPKLQRAGFQGIIRLEGHIGEFCLSQLALDDGSEVLMLPQPEKGLAECDVIGTSATRAMAMSVAQSLAFSRYVEAFNADNQDIQIEIVPYGASSPLYAYPVDINGVTTGDWNSVALNNNRVLLALVENQ